MQGGIALIQFSMIGSRLFAIFPWAIAAAWLWRILPALVMVPRVPDLRKTKFYFQPLPKDCPSLAVIVPAKNEASSIAATLQQLLTCDYPNLQLIAVDDRSTDATGRIMQSIAAHPDAQGKLRVLHVTELPSGWLGKPHAMALAAATTQADWLLFTDADVLFAPDVLRRAIAYAERNVVDHLVIFPTMILRGFGEHVFLAFMQSFSVWIGRPWRIANPRAKRDCIGVGAFNLIRRSVYEELGGFAALRMEVVEDMRLGYCVKQAGYAQHAVFGRDMVRIRWAESLRGMVENLTKNIFAAFRFRVSLLLAACLGILLLCLTPCVALAMAGPARWAGETVFAALLLLHLRYWKQMRLSPLSLVFFPMGICLLLYALLRSLFLTLKRGGVLWRGTLYPLDELRRHAGPLW